MAAPTIDTTIGGSDANSYLSRADANSLADERLQTTNWDDATDPDKDRALIQATRRIDQEKFEGKKDTDGQALKWPRQDAFDDDKREIDSDIIPAIVEEATFEMALHLLNENADANDALGETGLEQFSRAKVGPMDVDIRAGFDGGELPAQVHRELRPVLKTPGNSAVLLRT